MIGNVITQSLQEGAEQGRIALPDLARPTLLPRRQHFITADQQTNARPAHHHQLPHATTRQAAQGRHPQPLAGAHKLLARRSLLVRLANPGIGPAGLQQLQLIAVHSHQLLRQHPLTTGGHHRTGENPNGLPVTQRCAKGRTSPRHAYQAPALTGLRLAASCNGVAIHDRSAETRHSRRCQHGRGGGATESLRQWQRFGEPERLQSLEDLRPGLLQRQTLAREGLNHPLGPAHAANRHGGRRSCSAAAPP